MLETLRDLPRLAIATVIVGLFATGAAHYLANVDLVTGGERIEFEDSAEIPDSPAAKLGRSGELSISNAEIQATRASASDYSVFRVSALLNLTTADPGRRANASCTIDAPDGVIFARNPSTGEVPGRRSAFPQPSEDLQLQEVPEVALIEFNVKGTDTVGLEISDAFESYTTPADVLVEWGPFRAAEQTFEWVIRGGDHAEPVRLAFATLFRTTTTVPAADISCEATTVDGATAETKSSGSLG